MAQKKIKVAVLSREFDPSGGGAQKYCVELTNRLSKIYNVHVFAQNIKYQNSAINFHKVPKFINRPRFLNQIFFSIYTKFKLKGKFQIVHSHENVSHANVYTQHVDCVKTFYTNKYGIRKILAFVKILLSPRLISYLCLEYAKMKPSKDKVIVTVSDLLRMNIIQSYPSIEGNIIFAHPGINIEKCERKSGNNSLIRNKLNIKANDFVLLFIAHDFKRKGLVNILEALDKISNPKIHLIVCGKDDPKKIRISETISQNIHFLGKVEKISDLYCISDALIHPTLNDTFGMVALEAMSFMVPVILSGSNFCGISEYLEKEEVIFLDNPRDSNEISEAIKLLFRDPKLRKSISLNAFKKAKNYSWDNTLKATIRGYERVIYQNDTY